MKNCELKIVPLSYQIISLTAVVLVVKNDDTLEGKKQKANRIQGYRAQDDLQYLFRYHLIRRKKVWAGNWREAIYQQIDEIEFRTLRHLFGGEPLPQLLSSLFYTLLRSRESEPSTIWGNLGILWVVGCSGSYFSYQIINLSKFQIRKKWSLRGSSLVRHSEIPLAEQKRLL